MIITLVDKTVLEIPKNAEIVKNETHKAMINVNLYKYIGYSKIFDKILYTIPVNSILYIDYNERSKENS